MFVGGVRTCHARRARWHAGGPPSSYDPYPYDPSAASSEMAASRYDDDGDGICDAPVCRAVRTITLTTQFPKRVASS